MDPGQPWVGLQCVIMVFPDHNSHNFYDVLSILKLMCVS